MTRRTLAASLLLRLAAFDSVSWRCDKDYPDCTGNHGLRTSPGRAMLLDKQVRLMPGMDVTFDKSGVTEMESRITKDIYKSGEFNLVF